MIFFKKEVNELKIVAWRIETENKHDFTYYVQVSDIARQKLIQICKLFKGWNQVGVGWNEKHKYASTFIYARNFRSERSWTSWANNFPYMVQEPAVD
tara:strand:+ start:1095 stop:1385 length:291 start_codon:yes stop_codon:yes gene_type:complete